MNNKNVNNNSNNNNNNNNSRLPQDLNNLNPPVLHEPIVRQAEESKESIPLVQTIRPNSQAVSSIQQPRQQAEECKETLHFSENVLIENRQAVSSIFSIQQQQIIEIQEAVSELDLEKAPEFNFAKTREIGVQANPMQIDVGTQTEPLEVYAMRANPPVLPALPVNAPPLPANPPVLPVLPANAPPLPANPPVLPAMRANPVNAPPLPVNPPVLPALPANAPPLPTNPPVLAANLPVLPGNAVAWQNAWQNAFIPWVRPARPANFIVNPVLPGNVVAWQNVFIPWIRQARPANLIVNHQAIVQAPVPQGPVQAPVPPMSVWDMIQHIGANIRWAATPIATFFMQNTMLYALVDNPLTRYAWNHPWQTLTFIIIVGGVVLIIKFFPGITKRLLRWFGRWLLRAIQAEAARAGEGFIAAVQAIPQNVIEYFRNNPTVSWQTVILFAAGIDGTIDDWTIIMNFI